MNFKDLVCRKEKIYFALMLFFSILIYLILIFSIVFLIYIVLIAIILFFIQGLSIGYLKQNSVKITASQFPKIYSKIEKYSAKLGLNEIPDIYLVQSGGLLNAYATRFCFRNFVVIYSDVLELAYKNGEDAVNFIIAHELAHVQRKHLQKMKYIACAQIIPYLNTAYSRACETTCDNIATALMPDAPFDGMLAILAGKELYKNVDIDVFLQDTENDKCFWSWYAEIFSSHPHIANRIKNIRQIAAAVKLQNRYN